MGAGHPCPTSERDGRHWPSDVLAGYAFGLAWMIVVLVVGLPWAGAPAEDEPGRSAIFRPQIRKI